MSRLEQILDGLPQATTTRFFATFARFEYALMHRKYLRPRGRDNLAEADWDKLAADLGNTFFAEVRVTNKIPTLIGDPPKKLIVENDSAIFGPRPAPVKSTEELFASARRVRNNLFHGNKMFASNRERDATLMREVLWLLDDVMAKLPEVRGAFNEPQH
jgi:hypothetical protein